MSVEKLDMQTPDITDANVARIAELFPNVVTEGKDDNGNLVKVVDFDALKQELSGNIVEGPQERYRLDWPGKREAMLAANKPITKTLRPVREESVDFDTTKNLFIEGDNLDALKLLQETYLGKVKMIYIDPPYNTGKDFIYKDNFTGDKQEYLEESGQIDETGGKLIANPESNGRYHSDWLSMMYPRLKLARNLLSDDGVILISIDDDEFENLEKITQEIFGESNWMATLVWDKNRKNDAKYYSVGHEYMLVIAKSIETLRDNSIVLREEKAGILEANKFYSFLKNKFGPDIESIQKSWRAHYRGLEKDNPAKKIGRFSKIDNVGPYRDDGNISWPGGGGPQYEVIHPNTGLPCKVPDGGWRYSKAETFWAEVENGRVVFGADETTLPRQFRYLFESDGQVMNSVNFSYAQTATVNFTKLMGGRFFENPKSWDDLSRLIKYHSEDGDTVLDFFAGSATFGHAVMDANSHQGFNRKYILVQLPEITSEKSEAYKAGYFSIAEISKERLRRAAKSILAENPDQEDKLDVGFRVLKIDDSNMNDVYYSPSELEQSSLLDTVEHIKPDRTSEDLLFQIMLDWGVDLSLPIRRETLEGKTVYWVGENDLAACFDMSLSENLVKAMAAKKPLRAVFRDDGFATDDMKINAGQLFKQMTDDHTDMKVV